MADQSVVTLTRGTAATVRGIILQNGLPRKCLIRVECTNEDGVFTHTLGFTAAPEPSDLVCHSQGVGICFDRKMAPLLEGTTIDFQDGGGGMRGFTFLNPNDGGRSQASDPARLALSLTKLAELCPELFGWRLQFQRLTGKGRDREIKLQRLERHLLMGDSRAAVVISVQPLLVAAYSDDIDCVALLRFPDEFANRYWLTVGSRLLTVNVYSRAAAQDLMPGPGASGEWGDFMPVIAEFLSDDVVRIEARKRDIDDSEWRRTSELAAVALHDDRARVRPGQPV